MFSVSHTYGGGNRAGVASHVALPCFSLLFSGARRLSTLATPPGQPGILFTIWEKGTAYVSAAF